MQSFSDVPDKKTKHKTGMYFNIFYHALIVICIIVTQRLFSLQIKLIANYTNKSSLNKKSDFWKPIFEDRLLVTKFPAGACIATLR